MRKRLYDIPNNRKIHTKAIPRLGGVSFFPTILFSFCYIVALRLLFNYGIEDELAHFLIPELLLFACGMTLLYLTGIADDLVGVLYRQKLLIQTISASFLPLSGLWINNFYGLFGVNEIPYWMGIPLTMLFVVFITNAINLIDGIDGLASGLSSVSLIIICCLFLEKELWAYAMIASATVGVLIPFFYFNVFGSVDKARKIFMGDTGSLTLGYTISFLIIKYCMHNPQVSDYTDGAIVIVFSTLIIPVFDVMRVILLRIREGRSPFEADRNHIHHKFLDMGISAKMTMIYLILLACVFSIINIVLIPHINNTVIFIGDVIIWIGLNLWWDRIRDKKKKVSLDILDELKPKNTGS